MLARYGQVTGKLNSSLGHCKAARLHLFLEEIDQRIVAPILHSSSFEVFLFLACREDEVLMDSDSGMTIH